MSTVYIFHGVGGDKSENWFPWMKTELEKAGHTVVVPDFPHTNAPKLDEWREHFTEINASLTLDSILVGHSLGGAFALRLLEKSRQPVRATFLVASVSGVMDNDYDPLMTTFTQAPYDWATIRTNAGEIHVIHADNDPYIKLEKAETLAKNLGVTVELIPGGKHFNASAGYLEFPRLRDEILEAARKA